MNEDTMTTSLAKRIVKDKLQTLNLPFTKLTARTIGFQDLARANCIFVKIHGWQASPLWDDIADTARANGFRIET